jgi:hypothetical protein
MERRNIEIDTRWAAADVEPMKRFASRQAGGPGMK